MHSSESTSRRTPAASQPTEAVPELTPELVLAVLREYARAYEFTNVRLGKEIVRNIDAEGCAIVAARVARGLEQRPASEVLAFFRAQARAFIGKYDRFDPLSVARLDGIARAYECGNIDAREEDTRIAAQDLIEKLRGRKFESRDVNLAIAMATFAIDRAWLAVNPNDETLQACAAECARDFAIALDIDAPKFLMALRAFVTGGETSVGVDAREEPAPSARELFTRAAQDVCVYSAAAPFLLGALHELEQLAGGAPAAAIDQGELHLEADDVLREQIHRYSPVGAVAEKAHRLAWLLTDSAVFELPHPALANIAALADDVAGGNNSLLRLGRMFEALANVRNGCGGQESFAGVWANEYLNAYHSRVDVAEALAERMAQLAEELGCTGLAAGSRAVA